MSTTQFVVLFLCVVECLAQGYGKKAPGNPGVKQNSQGYLNESIPRPNQQDKQKYVEKSLGNDDTLADYGMSSTEHHVQRRDVHEVRLKPIDLARHISLDDYLKEERNKPRARRSTNGYDVDTKSKVKLSKQDKRLLKELRREARQNRKNGRGGKKKNGKTKYKPGSTGSSAGGSSGGDSAIFGHREESSWPKNYGTDLDILAKDHVRRKLRAGKATTTDSCNSIRSVPSSLKSESNFIPPINTNHYVKYTEAYGIPVIGSRNVTDHGLKRACYLLKLMYADRYDVRNWYYKNFGRFALIGDREQQTDLPEYKNWDPNKWNDRVRGLGPTSHTPTTSCGDDNQRCKAGDRYFDQDIGTHELGHAVEQLGAYLSIPGFKAKLKALYDAAMRAGKYKSKYASENSMEYFAVAVQFYFNSFRGSSYHFSGHKITDRNSLRSYDPKLVELLDEVFPCSKRYHNIIHRCKWKECNSKDWKLRFDIKFKAMSTCKIIRSSYQRTSLDDCLNYACYFGANAVNYKPKYCHVLRCDSVKSDGDLDLSQAKGQYHIYTIVNVPEQDLREEFQQTIRQMCTRGPDSYRCSLSSTEKKICSSTKSERICRGMGCCMISGKCYYPKQDCADKSVLCTELAKQNECDRNPNFMWRQCPMSCDVCHLLQNIKYETLVSGCQDKNVHCLSWGKSGECKRNPVYMNNTCPIYCGKCRPTKPRSYGK